MPNELKVEVSGHLVRDMEMRFAKASGNPFLTGTVARNKGGKDDENKVTKYYSLLVFGKKEEIETAYSKGLDKGKAIKFVGDDLDAKAYTSRAGNEGMDIKIIGWVNNLYLYSFDEANNIYNPVPVVNGRGKKANPKQQDMFAGNQAPPEDDAPPF